jgi:hypothetical protein
MSIAIKNQNLNANRNFGKIAKLNTGDIRRVWALSGYSIGWLEITDKNNNIYRLHTDELEKILVKTNIECKVEPARKYNRILL